MTHDPPRPHRRRFHLHRPPVVGVRGRGVGGERNVLGRGESGVGVIENYMNLRADSARVAQPLFHEGNGGSIPTSALDLWFLECSVDTAIRLNALWHSRLPKVIASNITRSHNKVCYVAEHDGLYYATAIWTKPVARKLPQKTWLELRRMAISDDAPKNTASRKLAWMTKDIRKRFPKIVRLISYQDCDVHAGTIYKAAGWVIGNESSGGEWTRPTRVRNRSQSTSPKIRWEKTLR